MIMNIMTLRQSLPGNLAAVQSMSARLQTLAFFGRSGSLSLDDAPTNRLKADPS
jgi:hypothetical protein